MIDTTTTITANEVLVLRGYEAFGRGDADTLQTVFHPDAVWTHRNAGRFAGAKEGFGTIAAFFGQSAELTAGTLRAEPSATLCRDDQVAVLVHMTGTRPDGRRLDDRQVHLFRVEAGRAVRIDQYIGDPAAVEAFWA